METSNSYHFNFREKQKSICLFIENVVPLHPFLRSIPSTINDMKRFAYYLLLICLCASVTSCKDDEVHEYITHINYVCTTGNELYTIQSAYQKAYSYDMLVCGYGYNKIYSPSRSVVLNACSLAEDMINNSKVEFKYFYVVEVKEDGEVIYRKSYGNFLQK